MHKLNVIISRTDTLIGKSIRKILGGEYNHCSVSFDNDFDNIYSFSRKYKYFWFTGCFCIESIDKYEDYLIYRIDITDEEYLSILEFIYDLSSSFRIYNYINAVSCIFGVGLSFEHSYICSTFTSKVLSMISEVVLDKDIYTYRPMDILTLLSKYDFNMIKMCDYLIA